MEGDDTTSESKQCLSPPADTPLAVGIVEDAVVNLMTGLQSYYLLFISNACLPIELVRIGCNNVKK